MDDEFRNELKSFIEHLFTMDNLTPKKVNGMFIKADNFFNYVHKCIRKFKSSNFLNSETEGNYYI